VAANSPAGLSLTLDPEALRPLIAAVVRETLAQFREAEAGLPEGRLCFSESEASRLLGLNPWQLRDCRLRGEIAASQIVGRRVRYSRQDLVGYLAARRTDPQSLRGVAG
jgi:hypothetical protein